MIIGVDASRAFVKNKTGTENYSYQILKNLSKIDTENIYKVYVRPGTKINLSQWPDNFRFIFINLSRLWTQVGLALHTFTDNLDLLFVPAHTMPLIRKPGLKTIMTVHDLGAEYLPSMHQLKQRLYLSFITNFQLRTATKIIAVSKSTKNDLMNKAYIPPEKIEVIYEGVDQYYFKPVNKAILDNTLNKFDLKPKRYFLFVGTIQPRKNIGLLIKSYAKLIKKLNFKGPDLVLAGSKGWLSDRLYKLPDQLKLGSKKVKFIGWVSDSDLPSLYSGALAFVYPSLYEGFGLPILEAMSCGCPVLASNSASIPEITGNAAILSDPNDDSQLASNMEKILKNDKLKDSLIRLGFKQIKKFNWEISAEQTLKIFSRLK